MNPRKLNLLLSSLLLIPSLALAAKKEPTVTLLVDSPYFSPNRDGNRDEILFQVKTENMREVSNWEIQFKDSSNIARKTIASIKSMPPTIPWDGVDEFGARAPEGNYEVSLKVWDRNNKAYEAEPIKVFLDMTPPTLSLNSPTQKATYREGTLTPITFYFSAVDLSGIGDWRLHFMDENKQEFYLEASTLPLPSSWIYNGKNFNPKANKIVTVLAVTDRAGNQMSSPPFEIPLAKGSDKTAPAPEKPVPAPSVAVPVPQTSAPAAPAKTNAAAGPYLQMTAFLAVSDLFGNGADEHSPLLPQAAALLDPLASGLAGANGSRATILGHVDAQTTPQEARVLSSALAWKVFSYLVKDKGVDPKSLSVKGLGADVPVSENKTAVGRARNRRIEIQMFYPSSK